MIGLLKWTVPQEGERNKTVALKEDLILHMRFLRVDVLRSPRTPEVVLRRRVQQAGRRLRKLGITHAVLPEAFAYREILAQYGVQPVSSLALRRSLAADWVRWELNVRKIPAAGAQVAVAASQLTGEVVRTVTELALRHRYVLLDLPYGGEDLCRQLRREYGVSLLLSPPKEQLENAEALVLFDRREGLQGRNPVVIPLYDEKTAMPPLSLPPVLEEKLPEGADRTLLFAALQTAGALRAGQLAFSDR